jgi:MFS family permease
VTDTTRQPTRSQSWVLPLFVLIAGAFRALQATPGGVLPVITLTLLHQIVPLDKIGTAMGIYGLGVVVDPAVGPTSGGYLVQHVDWRLIFYITVPIGTIAAIAMFPRAKPTTWPKFDTWGFVTIAYRLFALLAGHRQGPEMALGKLRSPGTVRQRYPEPRTVCRHRTGGRQPAD